MKKALFLGFLACAIVGTAQAGTAPSAKINYQGVLRDANDKPLNGSFDMVFRFWSSETGGDEIMIDTHAGVVVNDGLFSVRLGGAGTNAEGVIADGSGPGNYAYLPNVFRDYYEPYLEVEVQGEVLAPRTRVVAAPQSMNSRFVNGVPVASSGEVNLWVDSVIGNDDNPGIWDHSPKRTIQGALDRVPFVIGGNVNIYVADGTYNEQLWIDKRLRTSFYTIRLIGNEAAPENVVIDGQGLLDDGILVLDLVEIAGFTFTGYLEQGVEFFNTYGVVRNCIFTGNGLSTQWAESALAVGRSNIEVQDTIIEGNQSYGVELFNSTLELHNVSISGNSQHGIFAREGSEVEIDGGVTINNNGGWGVWAEGNSCADFSGHSNVSVQGNTSGDLTPKWLSSIVRYGNATTGGCLPADAYSMCEP